MLTTVLHVHASGVTLLKNTYVKDVLCVLSVICYVPVTTLIGRRGAKCSLSKLRGCPWNLSTGQNLTRNFSEFLYRFILLIHIFFSREGLMLFLLSTHSPLTSHSSHTVILFISSVHILNSHLTFNNLIHSPTSYCSFCIFHTSLVILIKFMVVLLFLYLNIISMVANHKSFYNLSGVRDLFSLIFLELIYWSVFFCSAWGNVDVCNTFSVGTHSCDLHQVFINVYE